MWTLILSHPPLKTHIVRIGTRNLFYELERFGSTRVYNLFLLLITKVSITFIIFLYSIHLSNNLIYLLSSLSCLLPMTIIIIIIKLRVHSYDWVARTLLTSPSRREWRGSRSVPLSHVIRIFVFPFVYGRRVGRRVWMVKEEKIWLRVWVREHGFSWFSVL